MKFKFKPLILFLIVPFFFSCTDNLDFDQINLDIEPIFDTPLVFFELDQNDFFDEDNGVEIQVVTDITDLTVLESSTVRENLGRVDLFFEVSNQFDRFFRVEVDFLDTNDNITFSFDPLFIRPGQTDFSLNQNVIISDNPNFLNSSRVRVTVNLSPSGVILDPDIPRIFRFKSAGRFYLSF